MKRATNHTTVTSWPNQTNTYNCAARALWRTQDPSARIQSTELSQWAGRPGFVPANGGAGRNFTREILPHTPSYLLGRWTLSPSHAAMLPTVWMCAQVSTVLSLSRSHRNRNMRQIVGLRLYRFKDLAALPSSHPATSGANSHQTVGKLLLKFTNWLNWEAISFKMLEWRYIL